MNQIDIQNRRWIDAARNEHRDLVDSEIFRSVIGEFGTQPYVTVMGPTQGGKTTLILRLMGLEGDMFIQTYETIRAGRPEGSKSTPCPTIYKISNDNRYLVRVTQKDEGIATEVNGIACDEKKAFETLKNYYDNQGLFSATSVLSISIPRDYFNIEDGMEPVLIDLPGFDGYGDDTEVVTGMYEEWVTKANCVLLVAYAEHMSKLNELDNSEFPSIVRSWKALPNRFKIVLTAYSKNQTVIEYWKSHKLSNESLNKQIKTILEDPDRGIYDCPAWLWDSNNEGSVFAFDYGKYWFLLEEKDKDITKEIKPILDSNLCSLRKAIENSTDELSRIRSDCSLFNAFLLFKDKTMNDLNKKRNALLDNKSEKELIHEEITGSIVRVLNQRNSLSKLVEELKASFQNRLENEQDYEYSHDIKNRRVEIANKCKNITKDVSSITTDLLNAVERTSNKTWKAIIKKDIESVKKSQNPPFSIEQLLRRTYRRFIFVTNNKRSDADEEIREELDSWKSDLRHEIQKSVNKLTKIVNKDIERLNAEKTRMHKRENKAECDVKDISAQIEKIDNEIKQLEMEFNMAIEKAEILPQLLRAQFKKHKSRIIQEINASYSVQKQDSGQKHTRNLSRICDLLSLQKGAMLLKQILGED